MPNGPGKYDDICTHAREQAKAVAAIVIIIGGKHSHGFSLQSTDPGVIASLPELLRKTAKDIEISNADA